MDPMEAASEFIKALEEHRDGFGLLRQIAQQQTQILERLERIEQQMIIDDAQFKALTDGITQFTTDQQAANQTVINDVNELAAKLTAATGQPTDISGTIAAITASDQSAKDLASQVDAIVNPAPATPAA